ncbi:MAG: DNA polymerase III subunit gamma/tau [Alphaproteobacteria bacterium]|jgi:DNA polymerase-3 subunit gamma/tau|nr:DNA polymerase III subunit gamma/tau [Alphaproteobacteria bacterium]
MSENKNQSPPYRVLARKYRPAKLGDLVGQDALVRTLFNAFSSGRLAHAFLLTGVRGIGKTTTARIIARTLNCTGVDGSVTAPVAEPCGECETCVAIAADRHPDVLEMDAASRTGVDDVREIIESVRYAPGSGRYKVYIIDEVHMLSNNAFNALLKTLEEPPDHVKFIFATTEVRKIPVTVLSRCQRFDLRRVDAKTLVGHLRCIAGQESTEVAPEALALIARAADGSVRDGLSLLDQAIGDAAGELVTAEAVRDMLGLADRERVFDLAEAVLGGRLPDALDMLGEQYRTGADPVVVLRDMLDLSHWLTRVKITPDAATDPGLPEAERVRGAALAERLGVADLARCWQILLKGLREVQDAPEPLSAVEMVLVRLAHAADLPNPADLVRKLQSQGNSTTAGSAAAPTPAPGPTPPMPQDFAAAVALFDVHREAVLFAHLVHDTHLVHYQPGRIELRVTKQAPRDLAANVAGQLGAWTGERWVVALSNEPGEPTLAERNDEALRHRLDKLSNNPLVRQVLEAFPGATIDPTSAAMRRVGDKE